MYSIDRLHDIDDFDYFLFRGVPALLEPMYARDDFYYHSSSRHTRAPSIERQVEQAARKRVGPIRGKLRLNLKTGEVSFVPLSDFNEDT